jgi:hypothetical protein
LHKLNSAIGTTDTATNAKLVAGNDQHWGYLTLTVDANAISGSVTTAAGTAKATSGYSDSFSYPAAALYLSQGDVISL